MTVTPVNDVPRLRADRDRDGRRPRRITLHGSDVETAEANLTFTITSLPTEGILKHGDVEVAVRGHVHPVRRP